MGDVKTAKNRIREQLLKQREQLEGHAQKSAAIIQRLQSLPEMIGHTVHCYVSMNSCNEVNTHAYIKQLLRKQKKVVVPVMESNPVQLNHIELLEFTQLNENEWGVLEPPPGPQVPPDELDLVIVPMVGADTCKNRIGYGKGYYDRFLAKTSAPKLGLCFDELVMDKLPVEQLDVSLDAIITEHRTIR